MRYFLLLVLMTQLCIGTSAYACTRVMWKNNRAVLTARTMDWPDHEMRENIWVLPREMDRDGLADDNSISWTAKYGSIVSMAMDTMTVDGMNEKGFAVHTLWLDETNYGKRDVSRPGISVVMWAQYYLDNFASVDEAVKFSQTSNIQIEDFSIVDSLKIHLILDDASGDTAVLEYVNGKLNIYHDRAHTVVTNSPEFPVHLNNLTQYNDFGGTKPLPGTENAKDRFVRAAYYLKHLPQPTSNLEMVDEIMSVLNNTALPYSTPTQDRPMISITIWNAVSDLTHHVYYHQRTTNMNLMWASLDRFDLSGNAPAMKLDLVRDPDMLGDVSDKFKSKMLSSSKMNLAPRFKLKTVSKLTS